LASLCISKGKKVAHLI